MLKELKDQSGETAGHKTQNESLQRRLQILEDEAEEADRNMRETNEKYESMPNCKGLLLLQDISR